MMTMKTEIVLVFLCMPFCNPIKINYLNGSPPGLEAKLFAPDIISTNSNEHSPLTFSPDGTRVLWAVMDDQFRGRIFEMKYIDGSWTKPTSPSFVDQTADHYCPAFAPNGTLYFSSRRNAPVNYPVGDGNRIWQVNQTPNGWGNPFPFDTTVSKCREFSHSISTRGTIYFSSMATGSKDLNIYKAERLANSYTQPVLLQYGINTSGYEDGPYIAPDESYLLFESTRPEGISGSHDLYICFKNKNGEWGIPKNMGATINSPAMERFPRVSPDGKYLFFASNRDQSNGKVGFDYYWIDAIIIEHIRNQTGSKER